MQKPPGFQFVDRTEKGTTPVNGSPPAKVKKWRVGKTASFDPNDIDSRVRTLEHNVKGIRSDVHKISASTGTTQALLIRVLQGQGWSDDMIESHMTSHLPPSQLGAILPPGEGRKSADGRSAEESSDMEGVEKGVGIDTDAEASKLVESPPEKVTGRRRRLSDASDSRTSGDVDAENGPLGSLNRSQLFKLATHLNHEVQDDMEKCSLVAAISHSPQSDLGCFIVVNVVQFPETSSQFCVKAARVCKIPQSGTSGPGGTLGWSVGMPRWTGKPLKRGEAVPAEAMGGELYDVPLSHCFVSREAAEMKAAEQNPPAKRTNPQDGNGAGARTMTGNVPGTQGAPLMVIPAFELAALSQKAKEKGKEQATTTAEAHGKLGMETEQTEGTAMDSQTDDQDDDIL